MERLLEAFARRVQAEGLQVEGIAVGDERSVLLERRFAPDQARCIYSHTKSYMALAVGFAVSEGKLSLADRLCDCFPEAVPDGAPPALLRVTLRDLLTMSSGFGRPYLMIAGRRQGEGAPDYLRYMLTRPMTAQPGEAFSYSTADSVLAGRMVERRTGVNLLEYLYERLFRPLGQGLPVWECCPRGHPNGGSGLFMRLTDMMKLGQLCLAQGRWQGARLIDSAWLREATARHIDTPPAPEDGSEERRVENLWRCGYGYQFWRSPYPDAYRADGAFGQITTVLPRAGLVVAVQCPETGDFSKVRRALHEEVLSRL